VIKVIHLITTISRGGAENQLLTLTSEQVKAGHEVTVIYLKGVPELLQEFKDKGVVVLDFLAGKNPIFQIVYIRKFLKTNYSIVHAHLPRAELISAFGVGRKPLIISKHNSEPFFPKAPDLISLILARIVFRKSSKCIHISRAVFTYLLSIKEVYPHRKNIIVHYGVPEVKIVNKINDKPKSYFTVGIIARIVEQKNYRVLIYAFAKFQNNYPESRLLIVGEGSQKKEIVELVQSLGLNDHVDWVGRTDNVYQFINQMDIFVLPSLYEGFGLVLLEVMQRNVPILASSASAIPEVMGANYPGLFPPDSVSELITKLKKSISENYRNELTSHYFSRLKIFNAKSMAKEIDNVYLDSLKVFYK
jgi:glycosyltransferase involved in cell wall biosynthesis